MVFPVQPVWFDHIGPMLVLFAQLSVEFGHNNNSLLKPLAHVLVYKNDCNIWSTNKRVECLLYFSIRCVYMIARNLPHVPNYVRNTFLHDHKVWSLLDIQLSDSS